MGILLISTMIAILAGSLSLAMGTGYLLAFAAYTGAGASSCLLMATIVVLRCGESRHPVAAAYPVDPTVIRDIRF